AGRRARDGVAVRQRRPDAEALRELREPLLAAPGGDDLLGHAPARAEQAGDERLADRARAEDRDASRVQRHGGSLGGALRAERHEAAAEAGEEVDAREAGPLAVRLEELCRLRPVHPLAAER